MKLTALVLIPCLATNPALATKMTVSRADAQAAVFGEQALAEDALAGAHPLLHHPTHTFSVAFGGFGGSQPELLQLYNPEEEKVLKPQEAVILLGTLRQHQEVLEFLMHRPEGIPFSYQRVGNPTHRRKYVVRIPGKQPLNLVRGQILLVEGNGMQFSISAIVIDVHGMLLTLQEISGLDEELPVTGEFVLGTSRGPIKHQLELLSSMAENLKNSLTRRTQTTGSVVFDRLLGLKPLTAFDRAQATNLTMGDRGIGRDASQERAVLMAMSPTEVQFIDGPAATGKTAVIAEILRQAVKRGQRVLLVSQMHQAVDNAIGDVMRDLPVLRLGNNPQFHYGTEAVWPGNSQSKLHGNVIQTFKARRQEFEGGYVLAATDVGIDLDWAIQQPELKDLLKDKVDLLIMDESSRETLPGALVPLTYLKNDGKMIFVGDHAQLPPFGLTDEEELYLKQHQVSAEAIEAYQVSVWEWLLNRRYGNWSRLLVNYRSHPLLVKMISHLFYQNAVVPFKKDPPQRDTFQIIDLARNTPDLHVEHERKFGTSYSNAFSARYALAVVRYYHQRLNVPLGQITILTPYKLQVELLRGSLEKQFPDTDALPVVTTIDKYQGGENKAIIFDLVRSNLRQEIGFMKDLRRLNVALSRSENFMSIIWDSRTFAERRATARSRVDTQALEVCRYIQSYFDENVLREFPDRLQDELNVLPPREALPAAPAKPKAPVSSLAPVKEPEGREASEPAPVSPEKQLVQDLLSGERVLEHMEVDIFIPLKRSETLPAFTAQWHLLTMQNLADFMLLATLFEESGRDEQALYHRLNDYVAAPKMDGNGPHERLRNILHDWIVYFGQTEAHLRELLREIHHGDEWPAAPDYFSGVRDIYYTFPSSAIRETIRRQFEALIRRVLQKYETWEPEELESLLLPEIQGSIDYLTQPRQRTTDSVERFEILSPATILSQIMSPPQVSELTVRPDVLFPGDSYSATLAGNNLKTGTYYDIRMTYPDGSTEDILNWQEGDKRTHSVAADAPTGLWRIVGVRAHARAEDHSGEWTWLAIDFQVANKSAGSEEPRPSAQRPVINSVREITVEIGEPIDYQISAANEPTTFGVKKLPKELFFDPETGRITGTLNEGRSRVITLLARNAAGVDQSYLKIVIHDPTSEQWRQEFLDFLVDGLAAVRADPMIQEFLNFNAPNTAAAHQFIRRYFVTREGKLGAELVEELDKQLKTARELQAQAASTTPDKAALAPLADKLHRLLNDSVAYTWVLEYIAVQKANLNFQTPDEVLQTLGFHWIHNSSEMRRAAYAITHLPEYSKEAVLTSIHLFVLLDTLHRGVMRTALNSDVLTVDEFMAMTKNGEAAQPEGRQVEALDLVPPLAGLSVDLAEHASRLAAFAAETSVRLLPMYQALYDRIEKIMEALRLGDKSVIGRPFEDWLDRLGALVTAERKFNFGIVEPNRRWKDTIVHRQMVAHISSLYSIMGFDSGIELLNRIFYLGDELPQELPHRSA